MTSLNPPKTNFFPDNSPEKQVYNIVEKFKENIPVPNDRNRLGYCLYKYIQGEGDRPEILVKSTKIRIKGMTSQELADRLNAELESLSRAS